MSLAWKQLARKLREERAGLRKRSALWEGLAKERPNAKAAQELDMARLDAFTGWLSARLLKDSLTDALRCGTFTDADRARLMADIDKVRFEDPEAYRC